MQLGSRSSGGEEERSDSMEILIIKLEKMTKGYMHVLLVSDVEMNWNEICKIVEIKH